MSRLWGKAQNGGSWEAAVVENGIAMTAEDDSAAKGVYMTPAQARELARALMELADEVDPDGKEGGQQ